ncbi:MULTISPECIES: hypothetical protein [unclassified Kitasatospora]
MAGRPAGAAGHYQDIAVAPFEVRFEGALFGLVPEGDEDEEDGVRMEFHPGGLASAPRGTAATTPEDKRGARPVPR